jgi:hypothetical protein
VFNSDDEALLVIIWRYLADIKLWASRCHSTHSASALNNWCVRFEPPEFFLATFVTILPPSHLSPCNDPCCTIVRLLMFMLA